MRIKSEGIVGIESNTGLGSEVDESTIRADAMVVVEAAEGSKKKRIGNDGFGGVDEV